MTDFMIFTDSACDISPEILKEWGVEQIDLSFRFETDSREYVSNEIKIDEFYARMRNGETAKTSAVNPESMIAAFEPALAGGSDILYLGFSSGLSTTYNSSRIAKDELSERYPDRKIICVDTLCASSGQGLLVHFAVEKKRSGADLEETAAYIEGIKLNLCHWFTVDDLVYLKRGGRISPTLAFVGSVLGLKPVLHVDNAGKLVSVSKARSRKSALLALVEKYGELALEPNGGTAYICQADCRDDAELVKSQLTEKYGADVQLITDIGPVIGAHSGPGTLAIFFLGKER